VFGAIIQHNFICTQFVTEPPDITWGS